MIYKVKECFILVPFVAFSVFKSSKRGSKSTLIVPKESFDWNEVITQNRNEVYHQCSIKGFVTDKE